MTKEELDAMVDDEAERLGAGSAEFMARHNEIMEGLEVIQKGKGETMAKAWMKDKATWLFDLAHGNLDQDATVKGFLRHYALKEKGLCDVQQDLHFHTCYGDFYMDSAMLCLRRALEKQVEAPDRSELRTLDEVGMIVQAVRAGERVQVDYYDPELDEDPFSVRVAW